MGLKEDIEKYVPYNEQEVVDKEMMLYYINLFEDVLTRENKTCHFSASSWIVNKDKTKVLMVNHNIYDSWCWTGGHADGDEDLRHVAIKELTEETSLKNFKLLDDSMVSLEVLPVVSHIKRGKFVPTHLHLNCTYLIEADENEELQIKEDENKAVKWINIEDIEKMVSEPHMIPIYRKINEKIKVGGSK